MAKKKKAALKPVARGFATTSQPKKVVAEPQLEAVAAPEDDTSKTETQDTASSAANGTDGRPNGEVAEGLDWEYDSKLEEGIYQGYVERLQEKGDREVAKILKVGSEWFHGQLL